ncbi:unnamed protein product, partial [Phaeothamnion confervicola]
PHVTVAGRVDGVPVSTAFTPRFGLRLDGVRLAPAPTADGGPAHLEESTSGSIGAERPARVGVGPLAAPVEPARRIGLFGAEAALGLAMMIGLPMLVVARRSEAAMIRLRLGVRLVEVADLPGAPVASVDLQRMADLVRIADRCDQAIMVSERQEGCRYAVVGDGVLYRYV